MTLMSWTGLGLGVIFGLPAAFFLLLLLRHVFTHRESGLEGLRAGRAELSWWIGFVLTGGSASGGTSGVLKSPEAFEWYVLTLAAIFGATISVVLLRLVIWIYNDFPTNLGAGKATP